MKIKKLESKALNIIASYDYPKLTALVLCIILAYVLFSNPSTQTYVSHLGNYGYLGVFIAGMLSVLPLPFLLDFYKFKSIKHMDCRNNWGIGCINVRFNYFQYNKGFIWR